MTGLAPTEGPLTFEELALATRNRGMPLEALRYDLTPTGLHHLLVHFDIPRLDPAAYRLEVGGTWNDRSRSRSRTSSPAPPARSR